MIDIAELADPIAVWKAVEGDPSDLIALLRGENPILRRTRDALADFFAGQLRPIRLSKGRPPTSQRERRSIMLWHLYRGHDVSTQLGAAGFHYDVVRAFIRKKGWHRGNLGWSDRLKAAVARRYKIELEKFINYLSRSRPRPASKPWSGEEYIRDRRLEIAMEIRRTK